MGSTTKLRYTTGSTLPCTGLCTRQARISWSRGLFRLYDSFYEIPRPCQHTPARNLPLRGTSGEQAAVVYLDHRWWCITGGGVSKLPVVVYIYGLRTRQARISWSTGPFEPHDSLHESPLPCQHTPAHTLSVRGTSGEQAAVVYLSLDTPPVKKYIHSLRTRQARISWSTGPFGLHDSFYESPRPCQHTSTHTLPVRGACGKQEAVMYISLNTPSVVHWHTQRKQEMRTYLLEYCLVWAPQ